MANLEAELVGELLAHHEVARHVCVSVVEKHANVGGDDLFDERCHISVLLLIRARHLVAKMSQVKLNNGRYLLGFLTCRCPISED